MTLVARVRVRRSLCLKVPRHAQCAQHALTRNPYVCTYLPSSLVQRHPLRSKAPNRRRGRERLDEATGDVAKAV